MRNKIKKHYKSGFNSSPLQLGEKEIDFIIESECKCYMCDKSIFDMDDFPELLKEDNEVRCEECYGDDYRAICPICEDSYDIYSGTSEYEVIAEEDRRDYNKEPGIYHNEKLIIPIRINFFKKINCGEGCCEVYSDPICPDCVKKLVRKNNYLESGGKPCILFKKYDKELFADCSPENLRHSRQKIIHKRITCRGLIERGNHITDY